MTATGKKQSAVRARITNQLRDRFTRCLELEGITETDFLTTEVIRFVEQVESKQRDQVEPVSSSISFRGQEVNLTNIRVKKNERQKELYYYELRHSDRDWSRPLTLEERVGVNFYGTIISERPIDLQEKGYVDLTIDEQHLIINQQED